MSQQSELMACYYKLEYGTLCDDKNFQNTLLEKVIAAYGDSTKFDALTLIKTIMSEIQHHNVDFYQTEKYVDVSSTMLEYLVRIQHILQISPYDKNDNTIDDLLRTMSYLSPTKWIRMLSNALCVTQLDFMPRVTIIILEDGDLDAFIESLAPAMQSNFCGEISIWVQKGVEEKLNTLLAEMDQEYPVQIHSFLQTEYLPSKLGGTPYNILSMWSENITVLKWLSTQIDAATTLINSLHEFGTEALMETKRQMNETKFLTPTELVSDIHTASKVYYHFYDNSWKISIDSLYTQDGPNTWAVASKKDVALCAKLALQGFHAWRSASYDDRFALIMEFAKFIQVDGNLVAKICGWARKHAVVKESIVQTHSNRNYELITTRHPIGVIILFETNEESLFMRLVLALLAGNAVMIWSRLIIKESIFYNYCEKLGLAGFPPNMVTFLLNCCHPEELISEYSRSERFLLCADSEWKSAESEDGYPLMEKYYNKYTSPKHVYMPLM